MLIFLWSLLTVLSYMNARVPKMCDFLNGHLYYVHQPNNSHCLLLDRKKRVNKLTSEILCSFFLMKNRNLFDLESKP